MSSGGPYVCVIMPAYRSGNRLLRAAESVLSQTYAAVQLAIAVQPDDIETIRVAEEIVDPRVRIVRSPGQGIAEARNAAIRAIRTDYCMFLDSDDEYSGSDVIATYIDDVRVASPLALRFADWVGVSDGGVASRARVATGWTPGYNRLLLDNFIATGTVMLPRQLLLETGGFDPAYDHAEDWDLWLRIARDHPIRRVPLVALRYRETKLSRPFPRSHFVSEMDIVRKQPVPRYLRVAALATAHGRHGLYYLRTLRGRQDRAALLAPSFIDLLCIPTILAYKVWRRFAGIRRQSVRASVSGDNRQPIAGHPSSA